MESESDMAIEVPILPDEYVMIVLDKGVPINVKPVGVPLTAVPILLRMAIKSLEDRWGI